MGKYWAHFWKTFKKFCEKGEDSGRKNIHTLSCQLGRYFLSTGMFFAKSASGGIVKKRNYSGNLYPWKVGTQITKQKDGTYNTRTIRSELGTRYFFQVR